MNALSITLGGLSAAQSRFETSARRIVAGGAEAGNRLVEQTTGDGAGAPEAGPRASGASAGALSPDTTRAMIDMMQAETAFKANAKVAGRLQDMQRAYLDMMAPRDRT
ncbi:hypothetical protein [Stappia sp.]|uniref:hypothetical protein n=1 Tax=Stappia sp. TaxID=1870903 RepID=UPI0032D9A3A7